MTKYFTSDLHLGHKNIIKYCKRPFESIQQMDKVLLSYWQNNLKPGDFLYILGDLSLNKPSAIRALDSVPEGVQIYFIYGNHDLSKRQMIKDHKKVAWAGDIKHINIFKQELMLCHYSMRTWNKKHFGSWQLYGHSHSELLPLDNQLDVGVDNAAQLVNEYRPLSFEEISNFIVLARKPPT